MGADLAPNVLKEQSLEQAPAKAAILKKRLYEEDWYKVTFPSALHSTSSLSVYFRVRPRLSKHGLWYGSTESNSGEYLCRLIPCLQTFTILSFFYIHLIDSSSSTFGRKFNFSPCKQAWKTKTGFLRGKGCTSDQTFYESEFHLFSFSYSLQKYAFCESDLKTSVRLKRQSH